MEPRNSERNRGTSFAAGIKAAAVVVILGTIAAVADHAFFVAPHGSVQPIADAPPPAVAQSTSGAFTVPPELHPNAGEVPAHVQAF